MCTGAVIAQSCHPINYATGNKFKVQIDYGSSVNYGLSFNRTYNSLGDLDNDSVMGSHWHHSHDIFLTIATDAKTGIRTIRAVRSDSKAFSFTETAVLSDVFTADGDINMTLTSNSSGYELVDANDVIEQYNTSGQLLSTTNKAGLTRTYTHDLPQAYGGDSDDTTLDRVTGPFGRTLTFSYNTNGQISSMIDPAGNVTTYAYDSNDNLITVKRPDDTVRTYHYENNTFIHALTGITDENDKRIETYAYSNEGRAISSEITGGIERVDVVYNSDGSAEVTDTAGETRTYSFDNILDVRRATGISGGNCIGCGDVQSSQHDANGNIIQSTDFNGNITTYSYNSRNLETSRTEGLGSPKARTITTQWHPDFRLPIQIDRPGQRTTYTYDAQGKLLSRTITDTEPTSPTNGESRTSTFSYTAQGLIENIDGPRTDVGDITTFSYDSEGNRIQTTNALGHITKVTEYNEHGQPIALIDANGIETELQYDVRRRLIQRTLAVNTQEEAITTYAYDGVGNLTQITLPDNSALIYEYDLANRLTAVQDNLGNRIEYTLDVQGNRAAEHTRDPQGNLTRQLQRSFDQLNRLKQTIGAGG